MNNFFIWSIIELEVIHMKKLLIFMIFTLVLFAKGGTSGNSS